MIIPLGIEDQPTWLPDDTVIATVYVIAREVWPICQNKCKTVREYLYVFSSVWIVGFFP